MDDASKEDQSRNEVLSFHEYMEVFEQTHKCATRPSYRYLLDMLASYHKLPRQIIPFSKFFMMMHPAVYGQHKILETIIQNLKNFSEEGFNNKFILLCRPQWFGKSSFIRKFMKGAEDYSKAPKERSIRLVGFSIDNFVKGSLGLTQRLPAASLTHMHISKTKILAPFCLRNARPSTSPCTGQSPSPAYRRDNGA